MTPLRRFARSVTAMVLVGLSLRVFVAFLLYADHLERMRGYWEFGWEMGQVAVSIFQGHGFANPLYIHGSGATAWMAPVYPYLIALVFKLFGLHTPAAAKAILSLNGLFAALTAIPVYYIARRTFGERVAVVAGWVWALFPYSIYLSIGRIWENTLTAMLGAFVFLQTLRLAERRPWAQWVIWGALWGVIALTSPVLLSTLPFLGVWVLTQYWQWGSLPWKRTVLAALVFIACITPWTVRNYLTFGKFIPLRDNFWLEFHVGNNGDMHDVWPDSSHPTTDGAELQQWVQLGEMGFMHQKKLESIAALKEHPARFAYSTLRHVVYTWTGFWSLEPGFLSSEPLHLPNVLFTSSLTLMLFVGFWFAGQSVTRGPLAPFVIMVTVFPVLYYITHPSMDYRHPLDVLIVILGSFGAVRLYEEREAILFRPVFTAEPEPAYSEVFASEFEAD